MPTVAGGRRALAAAHAPRQGGAPPGRPRRAGRLRPGRPGRPQRAQPLRRPAPAARPGRGAGHRARRPGRRRADHPARPRQQPPRRRPAAVAWPSSWSWSPTTSSSPRAATARCSSPAAGSPRRRRPPTPWRTTGPSREQRLLGIHRPGTTLLHRAAGRRQAAGPGRRRGRRAWPCGDPVGAVVFVALALGLWLAGAGVRTLGRPARHPLVAVLLARLAGLAERLAARRRGGRRPRRPGAAGHRADRDHAGRRGARRDHPRAAAAAPARGGPRRRRAGLLADDPGHPHDHRPGRGDPRRRPGPRPGAQPPGPADPAGDPGRGARAGHRGGAPPAGSATSEPAPTIPSRPLRRDTPPSARTALLAQLHVLGAAALGLPGWSAPAAASCAAPQRTVHQERGGVPTQHPESTADVVGERYVNRCDYTGRRVATSAAPVTSPPAPASGRRQRLFLAQLEPHPRTSAAPTPTPPDTSPRPSPCATTWSPAGRGCTSTGPSRSRTASGAEVGSPGPLAGRLTAPIAEAGRWSHAVHRRTPAADEVYALGLARADRGPVRRALLGALDLWCASAGAGWSSPARATSSCAGAGTAGRSSASRPGRPRSRPSTVAGLRRGPRDPHPRGVP